MTVPLLDRDQLAELADLVVERLVERLDVGALPNGDAPRLVDADTLARLFSVGRSTIYEHAAELGAVKLGDGSKAMVRFDLKRALAAWTPRDASERSSAATVPTAGGAARRRRERAATNREELLPIRGQEAA